MSSEIDPQTVLSDVEKTEIDQLEEFVREKDWDFLIEKLVQSHRKFIVVL